MSRPPGGRVRAVRAVRARRARAVAFVVGAFGVAAVTAVAACGFDLQGIAGAPDDPDTAPRPDVVLPNLDAGFDGTTTGDADADGPLSPCPETGRGPVMVPVGDAGYCIDSTEVTNAEYGAFIADTAGGRVDSGAVDGGAPPICAFNTTYRRKDGTDGGGPNIPAVHVNWCDAYAFCTWSGKRLCAGADIANTAVGEWYGACSNGGTRRYPYGADASTTACVENQAALAEPRPVGSSPACEGGVPGAVDMAGNAREWVELCPDPGVNATFPGTCRTSGSGFSPNGLPEDGTCRDTFDYPRNTTAPFVGIRCCADAR